MPTFWVKSDMLYVVDLTPGSIQDSIAKWEVLRDLCLEGHLVHDGGRGTCALCQSYGCEDCPVYEATGLHDCRGTPYRDYHDAVERLLGAAAALSAAEEMIVFLQSLLPESL